MTEVQIPVKVLYPVDSPPAAADPHGWPVGLPLLVLGGVSVSVVFIVLLHSGVNYQESFNVALAHKAHVSSVYDLISPDDPTPLYYAAIHYLASWLGLTLQGLRLLSLASYALMLPTAYAVAVRATDDKRVGVLTAVLTAFSPFMVWFASRGTMYAPLALLVLANAYFFIGLVRRHDWSWPGYIATGLIGLGMHFFFIVTLLTQGLFFILDWQQFSKLGKILMPIVSLAFVAILGYWIHQSTPHSPVWQQLPFTARPVATNVFIIFEQFLFGFQSVETITTVIALWPLLVILGLLAVQKYVRPSKSVRYCIVAAVVPVVAFFMLGWVTKPLFLSSYLIICLPPFMVSVAWYLATFELPVLVLARNILLVTMLVMLFIQVFNTQRALTGDYLGVANRLLLYQPALSANPSAYVGHQTPAAGPPLQVPSDSPGTLIQSKSSTSGLPVLAVGCAPKARPAGLHHSPLLPLPLRLVSMTKCLPPTSFDSVVP